MLPSFDTQPFIKRCFDIAASSIALAILTPALLVIALLIKKKMGGSIFFKQQRPGKNGKIFTLFKFRSMTNLYDNQGKLLPDEQRLTQLGQFLRSSSLDELPALINVIKGDMSLVGPRPLLTSYLSRYSAFQARRHEVKPGITGWAQINGRNAINWEEKFTLDVWYVDNQSLWLDAKILVKTFSKVCKREGINHKDKVGMTEFLGSHRS